MPKENQRVAISKRILKESVLKLLEKKHIDEISISELCQVSEINRTTFYRHYQTPHDVLLAIEIDFVRGFYDAPISAADARDLQKYAVRMCNFLFENKETAKLFIRNNTDNDLTLIYQNFADGFLSSRKILYRGRSIDSNTLRLMSTFFTYGVYALIRQWLIEEIPLSPEDVANLIVGSLNKDFTFQ